MNLPCKVSFASGQAKVGVKHPLLFVGPLNCECPSGWDICVSDPRAQRPMCLIVMNDLKRALALKMACIGERLAKTRVVCVVAARLTNVEQQLVADRSGVELFFDGGDQRGLQTLIESIPTTIQQRIRPDEAENVDLDMLRALEELSPQTDIRRLLEHSRTFIGVASLSEQESRDLNATGLSQFFSQVL